MVSLIKITLVLCLVTPLFVQSSASAFDDRLNIILLLTDDQATCTLGCYGNDVVQTPNIDGLARSGVQFNSHYVTTSICMASRCNIMTGLYEFRTGCNFSREDLPEKQWSNSYPMLLRKAGYRTAFAGKFGFSIEGRASLPEQDFDIWGGGPGQTNYATRKNKSMASFAKKYPHSTLAYGAFAQKFIQSCAQNNDPFCLSISFKAAHRPVTPDPKFDEVYANATFPKPKNFGRQKGSHLSAQSRSGRQFPRFETWGYSDNYDAVMQKYNQQVYAVDVAVGMIRKELELHDLADETVIIFTSDNGFMCGAHGYGSKVIPYEESMRVPLIIYHPKAKANGSQTAALTGRVDLPMTILELGNTPAPKNRDGVSLVPLLDNVKATTRESLSIMNFWGPETTHFFGVINQQWKYVYWYSQENGMAATEEMFDRLNDPLELTNAAVDDKNLPALNSMRRLYDSHRYEIKENARTEEYRIYKDLFDRTIPWESKAEILRAHGSSKAR